ncbi:MAG: hypothetical protein K1X56_11210, partial [Flavobacteriales bacterium]|nr:hypothetical protein [Flavobacteriales bacterium]
MDQRVLRVSIVGCGKVGASIAWLLLNKRQMPMEVNIMEPSPHNNGRVLELQHCQVLHPENKLYINNKERFIESDVIFHTSGVNRKIIGSRMEVALDNITITKGVFGGCNFKNDPLVIVVSNPVDIVSYFTAKLPCLNP